MSPRSQPKTQHSTEAANPPRAQWLPLLSSPVAENAVLPVLEQRGRREPTVFVRRRSSTRRSRPGNDIVILRIVDERIACRRGSEWRRLRRWHIFEGYSAIAMEWSISQLGLPVSSRHGDQARPGLPAEASLISLLRIHGLVRSIDGGFDIAAVDIVAPDAHAASDAVGPVANLFNDAPGDLRRHRVDLGHRRRQKDHELIATETCGNVGLAKGRSAKPPQTRTARCRHNRDQIHR